MQLLYTTNAAIGNHLWYFINYDVPIVEDKTVSSNYSAMPIRNDDIPTLLSALKSHEYLCSIGINVLE